MKFCKFTGGYLLTFFIISLLVGCTYRSANDIKLFNNSTLGTSRAFVEAVIKGDRTMISKLNRSDTWSTDQIITEVTPNFVKYSSNDFKIYVAPEFSKGNVVYVQTIDESIKSAIIVDKLDDNSYYFLGFVNNVMPKL